MEKFKMYTLYAKLERDNSFGYTIDDGLREDDKRGQELMSAGWIEDLDKMTAKYDSAEDLLESFPEEFFGNKVRMYNPIIYVDKHETDRSKTYYLFDIVYSSDFEEINNKSNIRAWLFNYLYNNPKDIKEFRGIIDIYNNMVNKYRSMNLYDLINKTILIYFNGDNYKRYREVYFKLKELEPEKVKKR